MPATDCDQLTVTPLRVENLSPHCFSGTDAHGSPNRKPVVPLSHECLTHKRTLTQKQSAAMTPAAVKNILSGTARSEVTALFAPFFFFLTALNILGMQTRTSKISFSRTFRGQSGSRGRKLKSLFRKCLQP